MTSIYYQIRNVRGDLLRDGLEQIAALEDKKSEALDGGALRTLCEKEKGMDSQEKREPGREMAEIRKKTQESRFQSTQLLKRITDLSGELIGGVFYRDKFRPSNSIYLGETEHFQYFFLDIVPAKKQIVSDYEYVVRLTGYLTSEGVFRVRKYLTSAIRKETMVTERRSRSRGKSKTHIRKKLTKRDTYAVNVHGYQVHLDLKGKICLHLAYDGIERIMSGGSGLSQMERYRLRTYSRSSPCKMWVHKTDSDFNLFIYRAFYVIAGVNREIFGYLNNGPLPERIS